MLITLLVVGLSAGLIYYVVRQRSGGWPLGLRRRVKENQAKREAVRSQNPELFAAISDAMFRIDPIGINFEENKDEYDPEAGTVIPRLPACTSEDDVTSVLHQEFQHWFGQAGDRQKYVELGKEVWAIWRARAQQGVPADVARPAGERRG
jgi:hypothetical protein